MRPEELTDEQWAVIEPLIPTLPRRADRRGRPWRDTRDVLNGVLWMLRHGARWQDLPCYFPPYPTCHRRYQLWINEGTLRSVLEALAEDLRERGQLDVTECLIESTCMETSEGDDEWERVNMHMARNSWQRQTALIFLSPLTQRLLRRMRSPLAQKLSLRFLRAAQTFQT